MRDYLVSEEIDTIWFLVQANSDGSLQSGDEAIGGLEGWTRRVVARPMMGWDQGAFWNELKGKQGIS